MLNLSKKPALRRLERIQEIKMIDYSPFWKTLEQSEENWYTLTKKHRVSDSTLHRLKHNMDISMKTVNDLCRILDCDIEDIAVYVPSEKDQLLWWSAAYDRRPQKNACVSKWQIALLAPGVFCCGKIQSSAMFLVCLFQNGKIYYRISYEQWR